VNALIAISKGMRAVKLCCSRIIQLTQVDPVVAIEQLVVVVVVVSG